MIITGQKLFEPKQKRKVASGHLLESAAKVDIYQQTEQQNVCHLNPFSPKTVLDVVSLWN